MLENKWLFVTLIAESQRESLLLKSGRFFWSFNIEPQLVVYCLKQ